jgi:hypothetical protein
MSTPTMYGLALGLVVGIALVAAGAYQAGEINTCIMYGLALGLVVGIALFAAGAYQAGN